MRYDGQTAKRSYTAWDAFVVAEQNGGVQEQVAKEFSTRWDAIDWFVHKLGQGARINVLSERAEAVYVDVSA